MKTTTLLYVAKAEDNQAISQEIGAATAAHRGWQITLLFYSALFWIRAYFEETGIGDTPSHFKRLQTVRRTTEVSMIAEFFSDLQDLSEEARYDLPEKDDVDLAQAIADFLAVRTHLAQLLGVRAPSEEESSEGDSLFGGSTEK